MYSYLLSYSWSNDTKSGYGRAQVKRNRQIFDIQDVEEIEKRIREMNGYLFVITNNIIPFPIEAKDQ